MVVFQVAPFLLGLVAGSFLNAVIYRLAAAQGLVRKSRDREKSERVSPLRGRSFCPACGRTLAWYDLIPVVSFALLRGRCGYCNEKISWQYPIVELATGALFVFIAQRTVTSKQIAHIAFYQFAEIGYLLTVSCFLIVLFVYDLKHYILPDKIVLPAIGVVLAWRMFEVWSLGFAWDFGFVISGLAAAGFFLAVFLISRGAAMGMGDVKLAVCMGLFLGWPNILVALFAAFALGAMVGIVLIAAKRKTMKSRVPFGPFLIAGTAIAFFWGERFADWYLSLVLL